MQTKSQIKAVLWSQPNCPACNTAKAIMDKMGIQYDVKMLGENATKQDLIAAVPDARSVPQIFLDGEYIGGLDQLRNKLMPRESVVQK